MDQDSPIKFGYSACPHDCPSTCALEVELVDQYRVGRVRGARANSYTSGVVCAKVARYAERTHHPDRLTQPMRRVGEKGSGEFAPIAWSDALDEVANAFLKASIASLHCSSCRAEYSNQICSCSCWLHLESNWVLWLGLAPVMICNWLKIEIPSL